MSTGLLARRLPPILPLAGPHRQRRAMDTLVSFEHARAAVLASARATDPEAVPLAEAVGRTLAAPVVSDGPLPPFDTSAMDGYAVRLADLPAPGALPLAGAVHAGDGAPMALPPGRAVAVMTGAPLPAGTEAVVPVEWTERDGAFVRFDRLPTPSLSIRRAGEALAAGVTVLEAGAVVTAGAVGLLASVGAARVSVRCRPVVAVVSTGDELVDASRQPRPGQIRDSNGPALAAQVEAAGGVALQFHAADTTADLARVLDAASAADVLVFAGGVSMGERDLVRPALDARGVAWSFWQVLQRPGKPLAFGLWDGRPVIGLPGNPVSAVVGFEVYVRPLLAARLGRVAGPPPETGALAESVAKRPGLTTFVRVAARRDEGGALALHPSGSQGSHVALSLLTSDGLAVLPADWPEAPAGARVTFHPWGW